MIDWDLGASKQLDFNDGYIKPPRVMILLNLIIAQSGSRRLRSLYGGG